MIYSYELEKQLLAGLLKDPESLTEISNFIGTSDFYSESTSLNSTIFRSILAGSAKCLACARNIHQSNNLYLPVRT